METLQREAGVIFNFDKNHQPIKRVHSGTPITIETYDCFENQINSEDTEIAGIDWDRVNPATGPVFIENAQPGDVLKVTIDKLEIADHGVMVTGPDLGVMGHRLTKMEAKMIPIQDGKAMFNQLKLPLNPMIGVIGVAPEGEPVNCGTPGSHGGNMDNKMITEGATLYFPVHAEGALFGLGDFHAAMGDGEVSVSGIEIAGKATVTFDVLKQENLRHPMLENEEVVTQIVSAETLDEAVKTATEEVINRLVEKTSLSISEATMLMSAAGQAEICQVVDPLLTARFVVPKSLLNQLGISLIGE